MGVFKLSVRLKVLKGIVTHRRAPPSNNFYILMNAKNLETEEKIN